jgi:enolase-phosphatase E1
VRPAPTPAADPVRVVLLDIEGTTTPVTFVYDVLFPFARDAMGPFLEAHAGDEAVQVEVDGLRQEHTREPAGSEGLPAWREEPAGARLDSALAYVHWLMDRDRKSTALKALQGRVWEVGFRSGTLHGELYADVAPALVRWREQGRTAAIFSSGSVLSQKLLFAHSTAGDLTPLLAAWFDTTTGPKRESHSYARIAGALGTSRANVLFVSDVAAELDAAREAGMLTALCVREGDAGPASHPLVRSLDEVCP